MKNWKRLLALPLSLALAASLFACGLADGDEAASVSPDASSIEVDLSRDILDFSAGLSAQDTLLTVNGAEVKADLMLYWLAMDCNYFMSYYGMLGVQFTDDAGDGSGVTYADQVRIDAVNTAAHYALLQQKAAELGCLPTDAQVQEAMDLMMADGQENYDMLKKIFGLTDESMEYIYLSSVNYENVLNAAAPAATDEALSGYVYQVKHILIKTVDMEAGRVLQDDGTYAYPALPAETVAERKKQAEDILAQIRAADDPIARFDELMNEFSEDGRNEDGSLAAPDGYVFTLDDSLVDGFSAAALALAPGEISDLVETAYGYHIMLRGEVADLQSYADDFRAHHVNEMLNAMLDAAEITRAPALDALDVTAFFDRYDAYQNAVMEQYRPAESGPDGGNGAAG